MFVGPFAGGTTPDLNGPGLFIRGGDENSVLEMEESQIMEHGHVDSGHFHSCSATSTAAPHHHSWAINEWEVTYANSGGGIIGGYHGNNVNHATSDVTVSIATTCDVDSQSSNIGGVDTNNSNAGDENRPANMKVVYIMRIY